MLKAGTRVRMTAEGAKYWGKVTSRKLREGVVVRFYPNSCPSTDRSPHHYDILWDGEGHYGVYDIDVELIEPEFNVQLASNSKDIDEMITLATKLAKLTGREFRIVTMCLLLLLVGACAPPNPGQVERDPFWILNREVRCHPQFDLVRVEDRLKCRFRHAQ